MPLCLDLRSCFNPRNTLRIEQFRGDDGHLADWLKCSQFNTKVFGSSVWYQAENKNTSHYMHNTQCSCVLDYPHTNEIHDDKCYLNCSLFSKIVLHDFMKIWLGSFDTLVLVDTYVICGIHFDSQCVTCAWMYRVIYPQPSSVLSLWYIHVHCTLNLARIHVLCLVYQVVFQFHRCPWTYMYMLMLEGMFSTSGFLPCNLILKCVELPADI